MPNSARDLLPMIQPATKALAQMLAGRTGASGQLGHARAVLAQTERLVADRAHNRLNPAEREEFFEQIARLKLTLADAESEAEVQAMEDEAPPPVPSKVDHARLKEMAMALTSSRPASPETSQTAETSSAHDEAPEAVASAEPGEDEAVAPASVASTQSPPEDPNQLRLPRNGAERIAIQPDAALARTNGRRRAAKAKAPAAATGEATLTLKNSAEPVAASKANKTSEKATSRSAAPEDSRQKLPKGWIIDDEGFVVPGPAA